MERKIKFNVIREGVQLLLNTHAPVWDMKSGDIEIPVNVCVAEIVHIGTCANNSNQNEK